MMVDTATFIGGILGDKATEKKLDILFSKNISDAHAEYPDEKLIITESPLPSHYKSMFSSVNTLKVHHYGHNDTRSAALRGISAEDYKSLISEDIDKYFAKKGEKTASSVKSLKGAVRKVKIKDYGAKALAAAQISARVAFYGTMFAGVNNLFGLNSGMTENLFPLIPDVLISTMPFFSVQMLERAMSDRLLKYRAIGDVFLAHQKGATDTLRLDMTLVGPYRGWYLLFLLMLQGRGESQLRELPALGLGPDIIHAPPHEVINLPKKGVVRYESHITFPIITKTAFMLDMFLQTIEWHQEVDRGGYEVIYVHLLFRKHIDPKGYTVFKKGARKGYLDYGETQAERLRKEVLIDTIWKAREIGNELFNVGMFGARNMFEIDREAVSSFPYATDIAKLAAGYTFDINNLESEKPGAI